MRFLLKSLLFLLTGVVAGTGAWLVDLTRQPVTVQHELALIPARSVPQLVARADLVVRAEFVGSREAAAFDPTEPGEEGWTPGEPGDIYTALRFRPVEVIKGIPRDRAVIEVLVMTGIGQRADRPTLRVLDERLTGLQRSDGSLVGADALRGRQYLLLLNDADADPVSAGLAYQPAGHGFGTVQAGGRVVFGGDAPPVVTGPFTVTDLRSAAGR